MKRSWLAACWMVLTSVGCGGGFESLEPGGAPPASGVGATPGGAQDMAYARRLISEGQIPQPDAFVLEGLYSEHDLPLDGPACEQVLCLSTATGIATALDTNRQEVFVQVGFSSNVNAATFHRTPLDVALVIDHSDSMTGEPMAAVKDAARRLVEKLDERDTFSLVMFDNSSEVLVAQRPVSDRAALLRAIDRIEADGSTCIECGLKDGYAQLSKVPHDTQRSRRVFLFTDAMPNVGTTHPNDFLTLVRTHSEQGQDLTFFGVNLTFDQQFVTQLSAVRGANSFYLSDPERIRSVFDEDFDYLVTPIAYDLKMALTPAEGFRVEAVYGLPGVSPGAAQADMKVATVFLSRRKGALLARLSRTEPVTPGQSLLRGALTFQSTGGAESSSLLTASYSGGEPLATTEAWYSQETVRKTVALTNFVLGAKGASDKWYAGDKAGARALADRTAELLEHEAERLGDEPLRGEAKVARQLAALMIVP